MECKESSLNDSFPLYEQYQTQVQNLLKANQRKKIYEIATKVFVILCILGTVTTLATWAISPLSALETSGILFGMALLTLFAVTLKLNPPSKLLELNVPLQKIFTEAMQAENCACTEGKLKFFKDWGYLCEALDLSSIRLSVSLKSFIDWAQKNNMIDQNIEKFTENQEENTKNQKSLYLLSHRWSEKFSDETNMHRSWAWNLFVSKMSKPNPGYNLWSIQSITDLLTSCPRLDNIKINDDEYFTISRIVSSCFKKSDLANNQEQLRKSQLNYGPEIMGFIEEVLPSSRITFDS